jgi:hypothetical protein
MYNWRDVAKRTETVYQKVMQEPKLSVKDLIKRYYRYKKK